MKKVIVLAGNREQFENYLAANGLTDSEAVYGYHAERIMGVEASAVVTIGTWYERKDAHELRDLAFTRVLPNNK